MPANIQAVEENAPIQQLPGKIEQAPSAVANQNIEIAEVSTEEVIRQGLQAKQMAQLRTKGAEKQLAILEKVTV